MQKNRFLLIIEPPLPVLSDESLLQMAYEIMDAKRPSLTRKIVRFTPYVNLIERGVRSYASMRKKESPEDRGVTLDEYKEFIIKFMRSLFCKRPSNVIPDTLVLYADDNEISNLKFLDSSGDYRVNTFYAAHPVKPNSYISVANYHEYLMQDKSAEFIRLVAALGVKDLRLSKNLTANKAVNTVVQGDDKILAAQATVNIDVASSYYSGFDLSMTGSTPKRDPYIPESCNWLCREPLWDVMAKSRIDYGIKSFKVKFSYSQDYDVHANLAAKIAEIGFALGGSFKEMQNIEQVYEVEFF